MKFFKKRVWDNMNPLIQAAWFLILVSSIIWFVSLFPLLGAFLALSNCFADIAIVLFIIGAYKDSILIGWIFTLYFWVVLF